MKTSIFLSRGTKNRLYIPAYLMVSGGKLIAEKTSLVPQLGKLRKKPVIKYVQETYPFAGCLM